ncbi:MAG: saccharopine dehydrogenase NADP-binding domain-containing protein [Planctomycetes bacterium]|nr:saccharopine dehydrogenase NADP-binding domain-containing protein [Planctomycetota bacterium]
MNRTAPWLLYGANGYTGRLITELAIAQGARPILAGRQLSKIQPLAERWDCPFRAFPLNSPDEVARNLAGIQAVLNCAGPFGETARPMIESCLLAGVPYLDITGEYEVIEWASEQDEKAKAAGIVVMPAVGFDVVPSDCLAALLAAALPDANALLLAFTGDATASHGTAQTAWRGVRQGGCVRRDGRLVKTPIATDFQDVPFASGTRPGMAIPWGDIASAYHTTGIPNIEVRIGLPKQQAAFVRRWRWLLPVAGLSPIQALGRWWIRRTIKGPGEAELGEGQVEFFGRVRNPSGETAEAALLTPNGYRLTAHAAWSIVQAVLDGRIEPGFHTPAGALGAEFVLALPGVVFRWIHRPEGQQPS